MNKNLIMMGIAGAAMLSACSSMETTQETVIGKQEITIENGIMKHGAMLFHMK